MNEFLAWAERMKAHLEKKRLHGSEYTQEHTEGQIDMITMVIDWFDPQKLKFDPKEAYDEL